MAASQTSHETCNALQSYDPIRRLAYEPRRAGLAAALLEATATAPTATASAPTTAAPTTAAPAADTAALAQELAQARAYLSEMQQVAAAESEAAKSAQAELQHVAAAAAAEAEAHARTKAALATALRRTADLERVVGELARSRNGDALERRVFSWSEAANQAQKDCARACAGLTAQQQQFDDLYRTCTGAIERLEATADIDGDASDQEVAQHAVLVAHEAAAAARSEVAYWRASAHDARLEARQHGMQLQRAGDDRERLEAALQAARAALAQEREQAKQASYRRWSSGSHAAAAAKQAAADTAQEAADSDTIPACWEVTLEADPTTPTKPTQATPAKPTHRRSASMVLC